MIKYLGSKRRLIPALTALCRASRASAALDLFTGTTRVAQAFKAAGVEVTAVDSARCASTLARCYVATDADDVDLRGLDEELDRLNRLPGTPGYVTDVFCHQARYFQPHNGARIDAIRDAIAADHAGTDLEPVLLTSLLEAADRVDSTTGLQMAYLKGWSPRSHNELALRRPALLPGPGTALRADAVDAARTLGPFDLAYLDPPYNQHRYTANYHVWETIVAWDAPAHYGVACKRDDLRLPHGRSAFNHKATMPGALRAAIEAVQARVVVVSCSNEGWATADDIAGWCAPRGHVRVLAFDSRRYVGAQIGVFNPAGEKVGTVSHLRNVEHLVVAGPRADVEAMAASAVEERANHRVDVRKRARPRRS